VKSDSGLLRLVMKFQFLQTGQVLRTSQLMRPHSCGMESGRGVQATHPAQPRAGDHLRNGIDSNPIPLRPNEPNAVDRETLKQLLAMSQERLGLKGDLVEKPAAEGPAHQPLAPLAEPIVLVLREQFLGAGVEVSGLRVAV